MKHTSLILFATLAVVAAACSDGDLQPNPADSGLPIAFDETSGAGVRAQQITEIADGTAFGVTGYYVYNGVPQPASGAVFDNVEVTRSNGVCTYAPLRYWSQDETMKIRFSAWYPYGAEGLAASAAYPPSLTHTVPGDITRQTDLLYAVHEPVHLADLGATGGTVRLKFQHALAQLHFAVRLGADIPAGYRVKVKRIALTAFSTGTMTFEATADPAEGAVSGNGVTWALPPEAARMYATYQLTPEAGLTDAEFSKTNALNTVDDPRDVTAADYRMYLIPQRMTGKITVDYELANGSDPAAEGYRYIVNDGVELNLATDAVSTLKPGTAVTYTLKIGRYRASVVLNVSDWEDGNSGEPDLEFN